MKEKTTKQETSRKQKAKSETRKAETRNAKAESHKLTRTRAHEHTNTSTHTQSALELFAGPSGKVTVRIGEHHLDGADAVRLDRLAARPVSQRLISLL